MSRLRAHWISCLLLSAVAGCSQAPGVPATPSLAGTGQTLHGALAPRTSDVIEYLFTGGSGKADWSAHGPDGSCRGKVTFNNLFMQFFVHKDDGKLDTNIPTDVTVMGPATGTCKGKPVPAGTTWGETFELTSAEVSGGEVNLEGKTPSLDILGSLAMSGPVCKATIHLGVFSAQQNGSDLHIDQMTFAGVKEGVPKRCRR